jgi:hypothetical protein
MVATGELKELISHTANRTVAWLRRLLHSTCVHSEMKWYKAAPLTFELKLIARQDYEGYPVYRVADVGHSSNR